MQSTDGPALVARILEGDRAAEEELVHRYRHGVLVIISQVIGSRSFAEDLSQETFALAIAKIRAGEVREPERLPGFVAALARNLAIAHLRKSSREEMLPKMQATDPKAGPLVDFLRKERAQAVRHVLRDMASARDREVLFRFYIAEEQKDSICAKLGLSSLHFNRVLYRARERFREIYEKKRL